MFNLENISKTYAKAHTKAVNNLTLTINNGEIFGFLGPNGAGKTTTIKLLTGILMQDEGSVTVDGFSLNFKKIRLNTTCLYSAGSTVPRSLSHAPQRESSKLICFFAFAIL